MSTTNSGLGQLHKYEINVYHKPQIFEVYFLQHVVLLYAATRLIGDRLKYPQS